MTYKLPQQVLLAWQRMYEGSSSHFVGGGDFIKIDVRLEEIHGNVSAERNRHQCPRHSIHGGSFRNIRGSLSTGGNPPSMGTRVITNKEDSLPRSEQGTGSVDPTTSANTPRELKSGFKMEGSSEGNGLVASADAFDTWFLCISSFFLEVSILKAIVSDFLNSVLLFPQTPVDAEVGLCEMLVTVSCSPCLSSSESGVSILGLFLRNNGAALSTLRFGIAIEDGATPL